MFAAAIRAEKSARELAAEREREREARDAKAARVATRVEPTAPTVAASIFEGLDQSEIAALYAMIADARKAIDAKETDAHDLGAKEDQPWPTLENPSPAAQLYPWSSAVERLQHVAELRNRGIPPRQIATALGIAPNTISGDMRRLIQLPNGRYAAPPERARGRPIERVDAPVSAAEHAAIVARLTPTPVAKPITPTKPITPDDGLAALAAGFAAATDWLRKGK